MQVEALINRALSMVGQGTRYKLGKGGMNPNAASPAVGHECDCTGFLSWCLGISRKTSHPWYVNYNGGWIETSAVWRDIGVDVGYFSPSGPRIGSIVVYPDNNGSQGHIAIVVDISGNKVNRIVHCSKGNDASGDAIQVTDPHVFTNNANTRIGWYSGLAG